MHKSLLHLIKDVLLQEEESLANPHHLKQVVAVCIMYLCHAPTLVAV